jgi:hypothetical protein
MTKGRESNKGREFFMLIAGWADTVLVFDPARIATVQI